MSMKHFLFIYIIIYNFLYMNGKKCNKADLEFKYTECDKTGHRWLVSVPQKNQSCDQTSDFVLPKEARNCGDPCHAGTYLDVESQQCKSCKNGTYSQGDTVEINYFPTLPPGFRTVSLDYYGQECSSENWLAKGEFLSATVSRCESLLSFTAALYKPGQLTFDYQVIGEGTFFELKVVHDDCQSKSSEKSGSTTTKFFEPTSQSSWSSKSVTLKKGTNTMTWTASGLDYERGQVKIGNLLITNSIFSSQCLNCSAGYFSGSMANKCSPCTMNTYSDSEGSNQCKPCPPDKYSMPASKSCIQRSSCTVSDYSYKWTDCDKPNNKRKKVYSWIEPKLCSESIPGAVKLPVDSQYFLCEPCPRGTFLASSSSKCEFCPAGNPMFVSDRCTTCPVNTKPILGILFDKWSRPVPNLSSFCIHGIKGDCRSNESWIFNGDHIQSSMVSNVHFLRLTFQTNDKADLLNSATTKSSFAFKFSMECSGFCELQLYLKRERFTATKLHSWANDTKVTEYSFKVPFNTTGNFIWVFSTNHSAESTQKIIDSVKIYSIQMSNLKNVGATECRNCDPKSLSIGCLDCDKGKYFSNDSHVCEACPPGHILARYPGQSIHDCVPCGRGLTSVDGTSCQPKSTYTSVANHVYDLTKLKGYHLLRGSQLFNTHGQGYVHVFNVTLFSDRDMSTCRNNMTQKDSVMEISSPMCRVTIISDKSQNNTLYSVQTISLAETFDKIEQSNISLEYWKQMNESLAKHGFDGDSTGIDLHVHLSSDRKTEVCVRGRVTIVTIRCDRRVKETEFLLPTKCPVETCDGCNFHFLLKSKYACPFCRMEDFHVITEECVDGHQKRHFQAPSYCILVPGSPSTVDIKCPLVTMRTAIIVIPTIFTLVFLIGLVIHCYKKNKKLEYKYMSLMGSNDDNEQVHPGSESCAIHDEDEDEDEEVKIKTNSKSGKMFARFNKPTRDKRYTNDMETLNLNDNSEFDI